MFQEVSPLFSRPEFSSARPVNRYRAYLLVLGVIYTLCFCVALPAYIDEAYSYNLATDNSLVHMLRHFEICAARKLPV